MSSRRERSGGMQMVAGGGPAGNYRALAHDPDLDGGRGGFWTASFGSGLFAVNMAGGTLVSHSNLDGWSLYGLAQDPCNPNMLWGYSSPNQGEVVQIDKTTGREVWKVKRDERTSWATPLVVEVNGILDLQPGSLPARISEKPYRL